MNARPFLFAAFLFFFIACIVGVSQYSTPQPVLSHFPGFTSISTPDGPSPFLIDATSLKIDPKSYKRNGYGVRFKMITRLDAGDYAVQEAFLVCQNFANDEPFSDPMFKSFDGTKYAKDGSTIGAYPGYTAAHAQSSVENFVCTETEKNRTVAEPFDKIKATSQMFGDYHPDVDAAFWEGMTVDLSLEGHKIDAQSGWTKPLLSESYNENGQDKHVLATITHPYSGDDQRNACAHCDPFLSVLFFAKDADIWRISRSFLSINAQLEDKEGSPELQWIAYGKERHGLLASYVSPSSSGALMHKKLFSLDTSLHDKPILDVEGEAVDLVFQEEADKPYDDIIVTTKTKDAAQPVKQIYSYKDGLYQIEAPVEHATGPALSNNAAPQQAQTQQPEQQTQPSVKLEKTVEKQTEQPKAKADPVKIATTGQIVHFNEPAPAMPYPERLKDVFAESDWPYVLDALKRGQILTNASGAVAWANPESGAKGAITLADGPDANGCKTLKITNHARTAQPMPGFIQQPTPVFGTFATCPGSLK